MMALDWNRSPGCSDRATQETEDCCCCSLAAAAAAAAGRRKKGGWGEGAVTGGVETEDEGCEAKGGDEEEEDVAGAEG